MVINPLVVDISHGDGVRSFANAKGAGLVGVIHKATTGATGRDDAYRGRRQIATGANLLWGAYHWGTNADVHAQVENVLSWAEPDSNTLVALDYESTPGNQMTVEQIRSSCLSLARSSGASLYYTAADCSKARWEAAKMSFLGAIACGLRNTAILRRSSRVGAISGCGSTPTARTART